MPSPARRRLWKRHRPCAPSCRVARRGRLSAKRSRQTRLRLPQTGGCAAIWRAADGRERCGKPFFAGRTLALIDDETGHLSGVSPQHRALAAACGDGQIATLMEGAAWWRCDRARHLARHGLSRPVWRLDIRDRAVRRTKIVSEIAPTHYSSGRTDLTPCSQCGGATVLENLAADEDAFLVEPKVREANWL
jgi:hypothetical protein